MRQGKLCRLIHHQSQPQLSQVVPSLLVVPVLWQLRLGIRTGDVGVKVRGVVGYRLRLELLLAEDLLHDGLLHLSQQVQAHGMHLIPEMLTRKLLRRKPH